MPADRTDSVVSTQAKEQVLGMEFLCEIPTDLGVVTSMLVIGDRVVCNTESGIEFIVPRVPQPEY